MRKAVLILVALIAVSAALFMVVRKKQADQPAAVATVESVVELADTDLFTVVSGEIGQIVRANGALRAVNQSAVRAKVAGEIVEVKVREGDRVVAGQLLARIDPTEFRARLEERNAGLAAQQAQADVSETLRMKNEELLEKNFISRQAYDTAKASADTNRAQMEAQRAQLVLARKALNDAIVRAPVAGWVAERSVQRGDKTAVDGKLFSIVDVTLLELEALVPANEIARVAIGQEVSVSVEGFAGKRFAGKVARIAPQAQAGSRSVPVYVELANADGQLKAGLFAEGTLALGEHAAQALVPTGAVRSESGAGFVYLVDGDHLRKQAVETGVLSNAEDLVEILKGLAPGARVVAANLGTLKDGARVRMAAQK